MNKLLMITFVSLLSIAPQINAANTDNELEAISNNQLLNGYKHIGGGLMKVMFWEVYQAEFYVKLTANQQPIDSSGLFDNSGVFPQA